MNKFKIAVYRYECTSCTVHFMVDQAFEEQSEITCPVCNLDFFIQDVGEGEVTYES